MRDYTRFLKEEAKIDKVPKEDCWWNGYLD